jgi:hypothetical protein
LLEIFGIVSIACCNLLVLVRLRRLVTTAVIYATSKGIDTNNVVKYCNNAIAILNWIQPKDEIEGMLAVQMIGVHNMAMETMKRAMLGDQSFEGKQVINKTVLTNMHFFVKYPWFIVVLTCLAGREISV